MTETLDVDEITEDEFRRFERVRASSEFNMVTEAHNAMDAAGLESEVYWGVLENYGVLDSEFGDGNDDSGV